MLKRTHISVAMFVCLIMFLYVFTGLSFSQKIIFLVIAAITTLIPDIDLHTSTLGRKMKIIGFLLEHRGFFHSLTMGMFLAIIAFYIKPIYAWAVFAGMGTHLLLDAMTKGGIKFFWPSKLKFRGPFISGKLTDKIIFFITIFADIYLFLLL